MGWLLGFCATLLALAIAPVAPTTSNDGSHLALAHALASGHVALGPYASLASVDHAQRDGVIYSDRAPGQALALVPVLWLGLDPRLVPALAFGATLAVLYGWLRRDGCGAVAATATVLVSATTLLTRFAPVLFSHSLCAFQLALAGRLITAPRPRGWAIGFILGWAGITEYPLAPLAAAAAVVAWRLWPSFYLGVAPPVAAAALYQWVAFGAPWRSGYSYQASFAVSHTISGNFGAPLLAGLQAFVMQGADSWGFTNYGLLAISPVLALAPLGLFAYGLRHRWQALLLTAVCGAYLLLYSTHVAFGAGTSDSRYYVPFLPLLLMGTGHLFEGIGPIAYPLVASLVLAGSDNLLAHIAHSDGWTGQIAWRWPWQ